MASMSFLQLINKPPQIPSSNPAFMQLDKQRVLPRWNSYKSEPKERSQSDNDGLSTTAIIKPRTTTYNNKIFARGQNPSNNITCKSKADNESSLLAGEGQGRSKMGTRVQYHHSFSNYLSKKPARQGRANMHGKLMYFDLNEIVNKIASPIKLERQLDQEESSPDADQRKQRSLAQYQRFLRELHHQKNRYHNNEHPKGHTEEIQRETKTYLNEVNVVNAMQGAVRKRPNTLLLRQQSGRQREAQQIEPWQGNEQQHSPMRKKYHSAFQPTHPIIEDLEDLM